MTPVPAQPDEVKHEPDFRCYPSRETESRRYPSRETRKPDRYTECTMTKTLLDDETDHIKSNIDYCYKMMCNIPVSFRDAVSPDKSR